MGYVLGFRDPEATGDLVLRQLAEAVDIGPCGTALPMATDAAMFVFLGFKEPPTDSQHP